MRFSKRLTNPDSNNPWYHDPNTNIYEAKHIGSCTQYAFGRLSEILNKKIGYKDTWYPIDLYNRCAEAGFAKSDKIGLGFGAVWEKLDGSGSHISVVEDVHGEDGTCSMWDINSKFIIHEIKKSEGYAYRVGGYKFVGFIDIKTVFEAEKEDYYASKVPERFKVVKNGKQINSYTNYKYAVSDADKNNAVIIDSTTGAQIYPETAPVEVKPTVEPKKIKTGQKFELRGTQVYSNQNGRADGVRTGTYYVWNATEFNGYIRMTNRENRVEVPGQISFWCKASDLEAML